MGRCPWQSGGTKTQGLLGWEGTQGRGGRQGALSCDVRPEDGGDLGGDPMGGPRD